MARVAGVEIPDGRKVEAALRTIYGIGPTSVLSIVQQAGIEGNPRVRDLRDDELNRVREIIDKNYTVESDLRREVSLNIRRLIDIRSYRGSRHVRGLPLRGQRTRTNARTKRGPRRTVAGRRRSIAKK